MSFLQRIKNGLKLEECIRQPTAWKETGDLEFPFIAKVNQDTWEIGANDFPDQPAYTLYIKGSPIGSFDDWPDNWITESSAVG